MKSTALIPAMTGVLFLATGFQVQAAEMDHSKMGNASMARPVAGSPTGPLETLAAQPVSGSAREASYDGRYVMEPTSAGYDLATLCAQGSRGIIILDNRTWSRCGGKPRGTAKGAGYYPALPPWNKPGTGEAKAMDHSGHKM